MRSRWAALAATAVLAAGAASCGGDDEEEPAAGGGSGGQTNAQANLAECQATIGLMAPITGDAASIGEEQLNWARLGLDQFNQEHGTRFELEQGDTQLDPAQASTVAQQFASNDAIVATVGPAGSQEVEAVGPVFERADMPFISQSATATDLTESGDYPTFLRVVPPDSVQGPTVARYMTEQLDADRVLIVDDQTSYSTGLAESAAEALEQAGAQVERESVRRNQTDFSALAAGISADTDIVFLPWQIAANAQQFGRQLEEQGKDVPIFGSDGLFSPEDFSIGGSYVSSFAPDVRGVDQAQEVVQAYTQEFNANFGTFGPPTYVATQVAATATMQACEDGEATREEVLENARGVQLDETILGYPIRFNEQGELQNAQFFVFRVRGGEFQLAEGQEQG